MQMVGCTSFHLFVMTLHCMVSMHDVASGMLEHQRSRAVMHCKMRLELRSVCDPEVDTHEISEFDGMFIFSLVVLVEACLVVVLGKEDTWNLKAL